MRQRDAVGDEDFDYLFADDSWWDEPASPVRAPRSEPTVGIGPAAPHSSHHVAAPVQISRTVAYPGRPWYRTKKVLLPVIGVIVLAVAVILLRSSDGGDNAPPDVSPPPSLVPSPHMSTPVSVPPTTVVPPPPPPPPSPSQLPAPGNSNPYYPGPRDSLPTDGPEIGVTRTPATRKPISVSPPPPPPPQYNQGDGRKSPF